MNIRIGKWTLTSEERSYVISEVQISKGKKTYGEEVLRNQTYHPNIGSALSSLLDRKIKESEAKSLEELKKDFDEAKKWVKDQFDIEYKEEN